MTSFAQPPVAPNAPSEPVWSLGSDRAEAAAESTHETVGEMYYRREEVLETPLPERESKPEPRVAETASAESGSTREVATRDKLAEPQEVPQSHRKGWWQRQFRRG